MAEFFTIRLGVSVDVPRNGLVGCLCYYDACIKPGFIFGNVETLVPLNNYERRKHYEQTTID